MALNIPVNLMGGATPPPQSQPSGEASSDSSADNTVQPTQESASSNGAATNDNSNGKGSSEQQAQTTRPRTTATNTPSDPSNADPTSIVSAQSADEQLATARRSAEYAQNVARTKAMIESVAATPAANSALLDQPQKVDRYAPPDPLPTAKILKNSES